MCTLLALLPLMVACESPAPGPSTYALVSIIPAPDRLERHEGAFAVNAETLVHVSSGGADARAVAEHFFDPLRTATSFPLNVISDAAEAPAANVIELAIDTASADGPESYRLRVDEDAIRIAAPTEAGLFYGLQTLRQLLPADIESISPVGDVDWSVPALDIVDAPRFPYRGLMLDVGRHFFPVEFVKRYIDLMARYKFNRFHWHLTEDQGWRIEIKRYPRLTEVGSIRKETILEKNFDPYVGDGIPYAGYYTQDEIRDVVRYAAERFVTIVPEIEMPGHSTAALAAYPELGCTDGPFEVATTWGVKEDIYCPSEETFTFLTNVLDEVMTLFPGEMIHVGGDEAPKRRWRENALAQEVIRRERLADEDELQSWFIHRIERYLKDRGRRLIGWDEILEGGLAPDATVMSWRGEQGGIEAARQGNDAVMTPKTYVYLDYYQGPPEEEPLSIGGFLPLDSVYTFDPLPDGLTADQATHILGGQANVWTEYIATPEHAEYMTYPRAIAVAEAVWSAPGRRSFADFMDRLSRNLDHLQVLGVNFRVPEAFRSP